MRPQDLSRLLHEPRVQSKGAPDPDGSRAALLAGSSNYEVLFTYNKVVNGMSTFDGALITDEWRYKFYIGRERSEDISNLSAYLVPSAILS